MLQSLMLSAFLLGQVPAESVLTDIPFLARAQGGEPVVSSLPVNSSSLLRPDVMVERPQEEARTTTIVGTPYPLLGGTSEGAFSGSITMNQDSFFGFYPILNGSYSINDRFAFTFYGLFWNNPGFSPTGTGTGLWTEFAAGVSFSILNDLVTINPAVGFLNGRLLSSAARADVFDGVVSQISFSHAGKYTEGQVFAAFYAATATPSANNFVHWWATAGLRPFAERTGVSQIVSAGVHFEQLYQVKARFGNTGNIYNWIGPYTQLTLPNNAFLRVSMGWDLQANVSDSFYKATIGYAF